MSGTYNLLAGLALFALGGVISLGTYLLASPGDRFVVAYGAIIVGAIQTCFGLIQLMIGTPKK
jgi:hypothetical protein